MSVNLSNSNFLATGATTARTFGDRFADILNVKDYGATGDGVTDDSAAIQATFNAAFGSSSNPNTSSAQTSNKPVFFPPGDYRIVTTLRMTRVCGCYVFGAGKSATRLFYDGPAISSEPYSTILLTQFITRGKFADFTLDCTVAASSVQVGYYQFKDPDFTSGGSSNTTGTMTLFENVRFKGGVDGALISFNVGNGGDTNMFYGCEFDGCKWGLRVVCLNALLQNVVGCNFVNCTDTAISIPQGSPGAILGTVFSNNTNGDIACSTGDPVHISGCTSSSTSTVATSGGRLSFSAMRHSGGGHLSDDNLGFFVVADSVNSSGSFQASSAGGYTLYIRGSEFTSSTYLTNFHGTVVENI